MPDKTNAKTKIKKSSKNWIKSEAQVFWGEIAPCSHSLQIYENDEVLLAALEGYAAGGLEKGESVVIIATQEHITALDHLLSTHGFDIAKLKKSDQYISLEAEETLQKFIVKDWPDEQLFNKAIASIIQRARGPQMRKIRAYGEMVAVLWEKGNSGATVQLEHLWNKFCATEAFSLFCAYPKSGFTKDAKRSLAHICQAHSQLIAGDHVSSCEILHQRSEATGLSSKQYRF
ncbi:MAG: hypothetical protein K0S12_1572 [Bacteroidetes bacterium]|nr:hypothetical protein [Bacteroidota bacterium]